jgi:serine/threonine-protein kinase
VSSASDQPDPHLGRVLGGKIEILERLGQGGMGAVYRARHRLLDKIVAVKVLREGEVQGENAARFLTEAKTASRLEHPNTVRVLDFGKEPDGLLYLVMEHVVGRDLRAVIRTEGRIDPDRLSRLMLQVLSALAAAHEEGIVHRDIKPGNVLLVERKSEDGGREELAKVCDFGLAKFVGPLQDRALTLDGVVLGTPAYIAPEQLESAPLDGRVDIYAAGVLMYTALSGQSPYRFAAGTSLLTQLVDNLAVDAKPLSSVVPGIDPRLEALVARAMAKDREQRFASATEMRRTLREIVGSETPARLEAVASSADAEWTEILGQRTVTVAEPKAMARVPRGVVALAAIAIALLGVLLVMRSESVDPLPEGALPEPPPTPHEVDPTPPAPPAPRDHVRIEVTGAPSGTEVHGPNGILGVAPGAIQLERGSAPTVLTFRAQGYQAESHEVIPSADQRLELRMKKRKATPPGRDALENPFR